MWINCCPWMSRNVYLPLKLNLFKWTMGRSWRGALRRGGEGITYTGCDLGCGIGILYTVLWIHLRTSDVDLPGAVLPKLWLTMFSRLAKVQCCSLFLQKWKDWEQLPSLWSVCLWGWASQLLKSENKYFTIAVSQLGLEHHQSLTIFNAWILIIVERCGSEYNPSRKTHTLM